MLEAPLGWYRAADALLEAGAEVHLAHPLGVKAFTYRRVKNDERDAADLADLLRPGRLPESWPAPPKIRELRELVRSRHKLVVLRASCRHQAHGLLAKLGVSVPVSVCSQRVLREMLEINDRTMSQVVTDTRLLLREHKVSIEPTALPFSTPDELLALLRTGQLIPQPRTAARPCPDRHEPHRSRHTR